MIELISNPIPFKGHRVTTSGYLHLEFEGDALYLSREHKEAFIPENALWFDYPDDIRDDLVQFNETYVTVYAQFSHDHRGDGHLGLFSGTLRIETLDDIWWTVGQGYKIREDRDRNEQTPAGDVLKAAPEE